jgi:NUDIX domain
MAPILPPQHLDLRFDNATAAILTTEDGQYLLQLRDDVPHIWYPDHWGLFGGSVEPGESEIEALSRELKEELELEPETSRPRLFTRFQFDLNPIGLGCYFRSYYEVSLRYSVGSYCTKGPRCASLQVTPHCNSNSFPTTDLRCSFTITAANLVERFDRALSPRLMGKENDIYYRMPRGTIEP